MRSINNSAYFMDYSPCSFVGGYIIEPKQTWNEAFGTCAVHACVIWSRTHLLIRTVASVGAALFGSKPAKRCPLLEKIRFR
uniref:Uncharacterized protein n=1 Tax=Trichuris muris TaxID=70415 RepID=A0A5S6QFN1_TRIMR